MIERIRELIDLLYEAESKIDLAKGIAEVYNAWQNAEISQNDFDSLRKVFGLAVCAVRICENEIIDVDEIIEMAKN